MFIPGEVKMAHTGRLFYTAEMVGLSKVQAGRLYWSRLNSDVAIEVYRKRFL